MDKGFPEPEEDWEELVHYGWDDFCWAEDCPAEHSSLNPCSLCKTYGRMATDEEQCVREEEIKRFMREKQNL